MPPNLDGFDEQAEARLRTVSVDFLKIMKSSPYKPLTSPLVLPVQQTELPGFGLLAAVAATQAAFKSLMKLRSGGEVLVVPARSSKAQPTTWQVGCACHFFE